MMRIWLAAALLSTATTAYAAPRAKLLAPDLVTTSSLVIAGRQNQQSPYLLSAVARPAADRPSGIALSWDSGAELKWKLNKIRLRVPLD